MKILENYNDPHTIHIEGEGDGFIRLAEMIKYIAQTGNSGHSFSIEADDGEFKCFWDGDGADHISLVKIDDKEIK